MPDDRIIECARQMFADFARISDPQILERRWNRAAELTRQEFIRNAEIAVETWRQIA